MPSRPKAALKSYLYLTESYKYVHEYVEYKAKRTIKKSKDFFALLLDEMIIKSK